MRQHPLGQSLCRVTRQHGHHGLRQYGPVIKLRSDQVHRGARHAAAGINGALMGVKPRKSRKQRGVDVDDAPRIVGHEFRGKNAHEAGQHDQRWGVRVDGRAQCSVELLPSCVGFVIYHSRGDARFAGGLQPLGPWAVADDRRDAPAETLRPALAFSGTQNSGHIGAGARYQDNDIVHGDGGDYPWEMIPRPLTPTEARVLATLMEKARTVPDTYPLSLNGVVTGCNQKTSREPVMNVGEAEAQEALDDLRGLDLVREASGGRVARYEHNFQRGAGVPEQSAVLLGLLMLRGPQTAGELRINTDRWYRFADISSVEGFLDELRERSEEKGGPLVTRLPRAPGTREDRWAHLLCGPVSEQETARAPGGMNAPVAGLSDRLANLEAEVSALRATVERLCVELGVSPPGPGETPAHDTNDSEI